MSQSSWYGFGDVGPTWPPSISFPGTLAAQLGQPITVEVTSSQPPAVLWLTDLDGHGLPLASRVITATSANTLYTPAQSGRYTVLVKAMWANNQFVSALFSVAIQP